MDVVVVGAGVGGLYAVHRLRAAGLRVQGIEAGDGVGGTWYWNRYPGCRCDVPTIEYSYSFDPDLEQEWSFPEHMSAQPDIERYLNHVADRHDLRPHFWFGTRVTAAMWDETTQRWTVTTDNGDRVTTRFCVMATGSLSAPNFPAIPGIDRFGGRTIHTGMWPADADLSGQRVGVIGTGSSGVQSIPKIAEVAAHLTVFQRTAHHAFPAQATPTDPELEAAVKANYRHVRELQKTSSFGISGYRGPDDAAVGGGAFGDLAALSDPTVNENIQKMLEAMIRSRVHDPEIAEALTPRGFPVGCKRPIVEINYYETYNRDNVTLVDLKKGAITEITERGVSTEQGDFDLDVLVFATGFDALTGPLSRIDIRGRGGRSLGEKWTAGPSTYLGLMVEGFPNLFAITGPGSPSVLSNMVVSIEQHVDFVTDTITHLDRNGMATIEPTAAAESEWVRHVDEVAQGTMWTAASCQSWYLGANIEGKTRSFMPYVGGVGRYRQTCEDVARDGYRGFVLA